MARFDELDEQAQQQWHARVARQRLDLSASVEETLQDASLQEDQEGDEVDAPTLSSKGSALIPPRLSLQSKPLPVVYSDITPEHFTPPILGNSALASAQQTAPGKTQSFPKIEGVMPAAPTSYSLPPTYSSSQLTVPKPILNKVDEATASLPKLSNKRTTKVRLQVVPKANEAQTTKEAPASFDEVATNPRLLTAQQQQPPSLGAKSPGIISGSGMFECGQCDLAIANEHVTASSVVVVVLTADPGPVVIQYVSLQPNIGFTVHLSAAAKNATSFNYTIL